MAKKTFITNSKVNTLKKRLFQLIEHSSELKFLVGFFYFSGWQELYDAIKDREDLTIKILVGLRVDKLLNRIVEVPEERKKLSDEEKVEGFFDSLLNALNSSDMDSREFYEQVSFFVTLSENNKLILRKTQDPNHAKLYLFNIKESLQGIADKKFITGSSNLTRAGILEQNEFNVEISDYGTDEAEAYFDDLWETAVPITEVDSRKNDLINIIQNRTQIAKLTPFEAYATVLKTYIDVQEQKNIRPSVLRLLREKGYIEYSYQIDAVKQALTILSSYSGVIIADVVGLGKSVIAGMIAKNMTRRGLIICPPSLIGDKNAKSGWKKYTHDFQLYDWEIRSSGDLENVLEYVKEHGDDIDVVIVDESHRFRNQDTVNYELLSLICHNRQTILLTATPFNNSPEDIFSMLKLFIVPGKSKITLDNDLESRFSGYNYLFKRLSFISKNYNSAGREKKKKAEKFYQDIFEDETIDLSAVKARAKRLAKEIKKVLEPVLIRRNRLDLKNDPMYKNEITELSEIENPKELFFELTKEQADFYDSVINHYFGENGIFTGAVYQPFIYEQEAIDEDNLNMEDNKSYQQQKNLFEFTRRLLVKRFESAFGSFECSINNFIRVHKQVLEFIKNSNGKYILDRKVIEKVYEGDADEIGNALEDFIEKLKTKRVPKHDKVYDINTFRHKDAFIKNIQKDLELLEEVRQLLKDCKLTESDPKTVRVIAEIKKIRESDTKRKIVIFTEYVDTVTYLEKYLDSAFPGQLFTVPGIISASGADSILNNFDASVKMKDQQNNLQILLTSDKLSEGVNLNRAGAVINYDIPWNPTRVIQRVGRINRIGKKVFDKLHIYNFFPTEQGADIVQSRQIAAQKMFLIHNTLGEDSKIFDSDEEPTASKLYQRVNRNPDEYDEESVYTSIRKEYFAIQEKYPEVIKKIAGLPHRVKSAKKFSDNQLLVFRKKGLAIFIQGILDTAAEKVTVENMLFEDAQKLIKCNYDETRRDLSGRFWDMYETIKSAREIHKAGKGELALEVKALNNLKSALTHFKSELIDELPFIRTLIRDLSEYMTLPKYTLRRFVEFDISAANADRIGQFKKQIQQIRNRLGEDYLDVIKSRTADMNTEVIIAIENIK